MKRIVIASIETDGHSGTSCFIATNKAAYEEIIRSLIFYDDEQVYFFRYENRIDENTVEHLYAGDLGEMIILVRTFGVYKEIENQEFYTRTG